MALTKTFLSTCPKCDKAILPHHICAHCGFYNGGEVIDVLAKLTKKEKKKRAKEEAAAHAAHGPEELSKK